MRPNYTSRRILLMFFSAIGLLILQTYVSIPAYWGRQTFQADRRINLHCFAALTSFGILYAAVPAFTLSSFNGRPFRVTFQLPKAVFGRPGTEKESPNSLSPNSLSPNSLSPNGIPSDPPPVANPLVKFRYSVPSSNTSSANTSSANVSSSNTSSSEALAFGLLPSLVCLLVISVISLVVNLMLVGFYRKKSPVRLPDFSMEQLLQQKEEIYALNEQLCLLNEQLQALLERRTVQLDQVSTRLNRFASLNSHQLRGPLTSILSLIQLFELEHDAENVDFYIAHLKEKAIRMDQVIHQINNILTSEALTSQETERAEATVRAAD